MAIIVTEDPLKVRASLRDPWRAYREFIVTGTSDTEAALEAVDGTSGLAVPQADEEWVPGSSLKCLGPEVVDRKGVDYWRIGCEYIVPPGGSVTQNDPDPLLRKPRVSWGVLRQSQSVDVDLDGRPILDTAGNPFSGAVRDMGGYSFNVVRNEPFFDITKSHEYSLCVCDRNVTVDRVTFKKYRLLLDYIIPVGDYEFGARYVTMGYQFHYLPSDVLGEHPWQHRFLNIGDEGWYQGTAKCKGKFTNEAGDVISGVRLDLNGVPIAFSGTTVKVATHAPISNPVPQTLTMRAGSSTVTATEELTSGATTIGYAIHFKKVEIKDLTPILFD